MNIPGFFFCRNDEFPLIDLGKEKRDPAAKYEEGERSIRFECRWRWTDTLRAEGLVKITSPVC